MSYSKGVHNKIGRNRIGIEAWITGVTLILVGVILSGCEPSTGKALPEQGADAVVEKFYEYISEAKITGGTTPLREAYKLISSEESRLSQARFVEIAGKYPPGFKADITGTELSGSRAVVTIAYEMPSAFSAYTVTTDIPLSVDEATNSWKIDFTGEMDGQEEFLTSKGQQ